MGRAGYLLWQVFVYFGQIPLDKLCVLSSLSSHLSAGGYRPVATRGPQLLRNFAVFERTLLPGRLPSIHPAVPFPGPDVRLWANLFSLRDETVSPKCQNGRILHGRNER